MKRLGWLGIAALMLTLGACKPALDETNDEVVKNVVASPLMTSKFEVTIPLPVLTEPKHLIEVRAMTSGKITAFDAEEGDQVTATKIKETPWIAYDPELKAYTEENAENRNLEHLDTVNALARVDDKRLRLSFRDAQISADQAARSYHRLLGYSNTSKDALDSARTQYSRAKIGAQSLLQSIEETYLVSPVTGVLVKKHREVGESVNVGELIAEVAVLNPIVCKIDVPESALGGVKIGETIDVRFENLNTTRTATITFVDTVADPATHSFRVEAEIPNADMGIPSGVFGKTRIVSYRNDNAFVLPRSALSLAGAEVGNVNIFRVNADNTATKLEVKVGHHNKEGVEIFGLKDNEIVEGMKVVTFGAPNLADGDNVSLKPDPTAESTK